MSGGGVGSVLTDLCEAMSKIPVETYILSLFRREGIEFKDEEAWAEKNGVHVMMMQYQGNESAWIVLRNLRRTIKALAKDDECCLFLHLKMGMLMGVISSLGLRNVKRIEVYHSGYMRYKLQAFLSKPFIHRYIAVSREAAQQLIGWFRIKACKIYVVYNGVDVEHIRKSATFKKTVDGLFHLTSVGRLSYEKGFKIPVQAYAHLREAGRLPYSTYTVIGDGVQRKECEALGKGFVSFAGLLPREMVYKSIGASDVMILPSLWEGNSILMLEVLALGRPMVLTDIPSFREVLGFEPLMENETCRKEWFGVVFRKDDLESCKDALCLIYEERSAFVDMSCRILSLGDKFSTKGQAREYIRIAKEC